ncbi:hypothetical protein [Paenibacillus durus]|uniref:Uncharacterized protein n=1 Tax=Paenibacillus durus TaxID=44251 RepID=A0A089HT08_PAEDU|nr:hypothetical protein [Paenibacillus durus]AIQ15171.1 hypothetical protein PDUR_27390 [Paenibacillus durus]
MSGPVYARVYYAIKSGLVADMGGEGDCWPNQETVAQALGVTRKAAKVYYVKLPVSLASPNNCNI